MAVVIRAHFDGKAIIPDEPVDLPINEPLEFELKQAPGEFKWDPEKAREAIRQIAARPSLSGYQMRHFGARAYTNRTAGYEGPHRCRTRRRHILLSSP